MIPVEKADFRLRGGNVHNLGYFVIQKPWELFVSNGLLKKKQGVTLMHWIYKNLQIHNDTKKRQEKKKTPHVINRKE